MSNVPNLNQPRPKQPTQEVVSIATAPIDAQPRADAYDPYVSPAEYLRSRGWKPLGPIAWESTRWLDPTKPTDTLGTYHLEPCFALTQKGERKRVQAQIGDGEKRDVEQSVWSPPATPMTLVDALQCQLIYDEQSRKASLEKAAA